MLTDEQIIQRLRGALESEAAGINPPPGLHAAIRREIRTPPPSDRRYRWRKPALRLWVPNLGGVVTALASLSAVAIAVVAIATLGNSRSGAGAGAHGPVTVAMLEAKLAVMRRPQTAADRLPPDLPRLIAGSEHADVIGKLTRLAAVVDAGSHGQVKVYVIVEKPAAGRVPRAGASASPGAAWTVTRGNRHFYSTGPGAPAVAPGAKVAPSRSGAQIVGSPGNVRRVGDVAMSVVPDGVTRVDWIFAGLRAGVPGEQSWLIQPSVKNNVAVAKVPRKDGYLSSVTWYGADRHVVASFNDEAQIARQEVTRAEAMGRTSLPIPASLRQHFAVFRSPPSPPAVRRVLPYALARDTVQNDAFGLNIDEARFVPYPGAPSQPGGRPGIWLIPGTSGVALTDGSAGTGNPFSIVYQEGALILANSTGGGSSSSGGLHPGGRQSTGTAGGQGMETVGGLVPDGNSTVTVDLAGGAVRTVPVVDNVFSITVRGRRVVAVIAKNLAGREVTFS